MNLSDYMGGRGLWKFNSMGGGVEKKVPSSPPQVFFSGIALNKILLCSSKRKFTFTPCIHLQYMLCVKQKLMQNILADIPK